MTQNKHLESIFGDFLEEEGILDEIESAAVKNILAYQLQQELTNRHITKTDQAGRMNASHTAVNWLLGPDNQSVHLLTLQNAARAWGKNLHVRIS